MINLMNIYNKVKSQMAEAGVLSLLFPLFSLLVLTACSQDESELAEGTQGRLRFNLYDQGASATRATTDRATMKTTFETGDEAGLYVVNNGTVTYTNVKLTYNGVIGAWEPEEDIAVGDETSATRFYAYYPYSEEATFDAAAADPFAAMAAQAPSAEQGTLEAYEAADLLTTGAATADRLYAVNLPLTHRRSLACVELPTKTYIFTNDDVSPYVMERVESSAFTLNGTAATPYFDDASQTYRMIVQPGQQGTLGISYTSQGATKSAQVTNLAQIGEGKYATYKVDGGIVGTSWTLQVGDYYCADGTLVSKDATTLPGNIVGVVFKIGTTFALREADSHWSHGVVLGLKEVRAKWGNNASTTAAENAAGWRYWYRSYGLSDQNGQTNAANLNEGLMAEEGFTVTKAWRAVPEPLEIGGIICDFTKPMNAVVNQWIADNPLPAEVCSGWYIPSLGDWHNIEAQLSLLGTQLTAAGGANIRWNTGGSDTYWSCNVRGAGSNWCYVGKKTALTDRYKGVGCKDNAYYRMLFAF